VWRMNVLLIRIRRCAALAVLCSSVMISFLFSCALFDVSLSNHGFHPVARLCAQPTPTCRTRQSSRPSAAVRPVVHVAYVGGIRAHVYSLVV
jgi:hypothetical protein